MNKKYVLIGVPIILLILLFLFGGFAGITAFMFSGCLSEDRPGCMGQSATSLFGLTVSNSFIGSLIISFVIAFIAATSKVIMAMIKKGDINWHDVSFGLFWDFVVVLLVLSLITIMISKTIIY